jgi:SNF2 family DNA or RNA helicase
MFEYRKELRDYILQSLENNLNETSAIAEQPSSILTPLRPHQLTLLAAARDLEKKSSLTNFQLTSPMLVTHYGVLADRVGSGKSLVALSLIMDPPPEHIDIDVRSGNPMGDSLSILLKQMPPAHDISANGMLYTRTSLCIVPHNVCCQWESYITDQTTLRANVIKRTKDCNKTLPEFLNADLILVSSTMIKKFISAVPKFHSIVWSRLLVDEADSIQCTVRHNEIHARFTWFISASWVNMLFPSGIHSFSINNLPDDIRSKLGNSYIHGIHSRYGFIYNTLADSRYTEFTTLLLRNSDEWIDKSLKRPTIKQQTILCKTPSNLKILQDFISPAAMEALHAGNTAGAIEVLGLKMTSKDNIVDLVTASLRGNLNQAERLLEFKKTMDYSTPINKIAAIEKAEQKVSRLKEQLVSLEARVTGAIQQKCPVCFEDPVTPTLTPCCKQCFCLSCLCECMNTKSSCPLCRTHINSVSELLIVGDVDTCTGTEQLPTKGAALLHLIQTSNENDRLLVFSAHEASFKGLKELLSAQNIRCELLSGSGTRIERLRKQFEDGSIRVLCMNARHVGAGINLEAATHVVLYHKMNIAVERQVIGRAIRFERTSELTICHLVHDGETVFNGEQSSEVIIHA